MRNQNIRNSVIKMNHLQNTLASKQEVDNLEKKAMDLVNKPAEITIPKEE